MPTDNVFALRMPYEELTEIRVAAKRNGRSAGAEIRHRLKLQPETRYVSMELGSGARRLAFCLTNDNRWITWISGARPDPGCCARGHERIHDALDHGLSVLRAEMLSEARLIEDHWSPADVAGAHDDAH